MWFSFVCVMLICDFSSVSFGIGCSPIYCGMNAQNLEEPIKVSVCCVFTVYYITPCCYFFVIVFLIKTYT